MRSRVSSNGTGQGNKLPQLATTSKRYQAIADHGCKRRSSASAGVSLQTSSGLLPGIPPQKMMVPAKPTGSRASTSSQSIEGKGFNITLPVLHGSARSNARKRSCVRACVNAQIKLHGSQRLTSYHPRSGGSRPRCPSMWKPTAGTSRACT